ncbi:phosphotransferase [Corynebacterium pacaense]|uniref:phosphotransferase n=1 Tax=Corynebacterium pacaense TaxID=1816684 RepID=UPI0009BC38A8|nr:phosphotransferase [Corynebacterium pacaense]
MSIAEFLPGERFYGAKSQPITSVHILVSREIGANTLVIARVNDALYQLLVDATGHDVLAAHAAEVGPGLGEWISDTPFPAGPFRQLGGEQSNTSLVAGETIVKYFRKLEAGTNPDVELLSGISDCPNIAPVTGHSTIDLGGQPYTLAMAQKFIPGRDGWDYALGTVEGSFAEDARLLGAATRNVHTALATAFGATRASVSEGLLARLDSLLAQAPVLEPYRGQVEEVYAGVQGEVDIQRIHGDLHLGQVLRTEDRFILIDFEGEPARPLPERRRPDSPLRDVAGMLRSIDYAAHFAGSRPGWGREAAEGFLAGYGEISHPRLLDAYVLDKALYEVAYETNNRPDWVHIPLAAVRRVLGS